jgi:NAD+ synthase (glutamine-hydrolysing)
MPYRIALAQINTTVGDLDGNTKKIIRGIERARDARADLVAFPELAVTGYPPEDLLLKRRFVQQNIEHVQRIAEETTGLTAVVGFAHPEGRLYNAAAILHDGRLADIYHKTALPNYGVFDEKRYFQSGRRVPVYRIGSMVLGVNICEDIWVEDGVYREQAEAGARLIVNISASPYSAGKGREREDLLRRRARQCSAGLAFVNLVGGQDELVFDGQSAVVLPDGRLFALAEQFEEDLLLVDFPADEQPPPRAREGSRAERMDLRAPEPRNSRGTVAPRIEAPLDATEEIYRALVLGTHDYVRKNGFEKVVLGLSGGIDSALTATIAADALGSSNVVGIAMPSHISSAGSLSDAQETARNLEITLKTIPIKRVFDAFLAELAPEFGGRPQDEAEENVQARIRGVLLMALSNKFGWLVLSTGNKSEAGVGYATLYGDMAGGFSVLKDVPKTLVYRLARHRNAKSGWAVIPESVLRKAPSAELKPDQKDEDTLPPYNVLDPILEAYVEKDMARDEIVALGYDPETVSRVTHMVDRSEYKRRQAAPGVKITPRAYGKDRRFPITQAYRG